jgi:heat shock protein HslJ
MRRNLRFTLLLIVLLAFTLAACGGDDEPTPTPAAAAAPNNTPEPAAEATPAEEPTVASSEELTATEEMTGAEGMTATEEMTGAEELTATEEMTGAEEMTATEEVTGAEEITGTEELTATEEMTGAEEMTATEELTGAEEMTVTEELTATEEVTAAADGAEFVGFYLASLPAASSPGRAITLTLESDGSASMVTDYLNDEEPISEVGTWVVNNDGSATVTLTGQVDRTYEVPVAITFSLEGTTLTATEFDERLYGSEGLTLEKEADAGATGSDSLVGKWQLVRIAYSDDSEVVPDDPTLYTIEFLADGQVAIQNDCNRGAGTYEVDGPSLQFGPIAFTRAMCAPGSLFDEFAQNLTNVASYMVEDGMLYIALAIDTGIMEFEPAS